ncbi:hypothetical protein PM10SUCC1_12420 [Propionigenium maris DSM 9537]|uniref:Uncharacterized protein n=1 Tax=Propionigenium maris DSM 9537 TaxID=1123000 RepID=A0A9W6LMR0_9FUSO|nr:hypothetical protein [Propionigenium maris]GLI55728.1 hypothetical protein PM10SUCC1_12420 [Propionigenium maris DSM 9537]
MEKLEEYRWPVLKALTISLFFLYFFIKGRLLGESDLYDHLNLIFGVYYYFLILYPLLLTSSLFIGNKKKESVLKIRLFSGILFFFFCTFYILMGELQTSVLTGRDLEQQLVKVAWTQMNLGGVSTSIMHFLYFNMDTQILYRTVIGGISFTAFILFAKAVTESIRSILGMAAKSRERRELRRKEEELQAKITIKEEIDKKMALKKQKSLQQQEEKIQQRVDLFMQRDETAEDETVEEPLKEEISCESSAGETLSLDDLLNLVEEQRDQAERDVDPSEKEHRQEEKKDEDNRLEDRTTAAEDTDNKGERNDTSI